MRRVLKIFIREKDLAGLEVLAQHVRTEDNIVADIISPGKFVEAENKIQQYPFLEWEEYNDVMTAWEP